MRAQNRALRVLNLDWNGLEDEGCQFLGIMLTSKRALANLRLNHTRCGPAGALLLAEGVARNVTLKRLELKGNPIGDDGGRHLLTALQSNKVLETIQMEGSNLSVKSHGQERFNFKSPEGHYKLNLANPVDRAVASRLCALDAQSAAAAAAAGSDKASRPQSPDTPEELRAPVAAPVSCWRDAKLNNCPVKGTPGAKKWPEKMPKKGVLEFDYVAFRGGHSQAELTPLDQKDLEDLCEQLSRATVSNFERLSFVRLFASSCYFRSQQVGFHFFSAFLARFNSSQVWKYLVILEYAECNSWLMISVQSQFHSASAALRVELLLPVPTGGFHDNVSSSVLVRLKYGARYSKNRSQQVKPIS